MLVCTCKNRSYGNGIGGLLVGSGLGRQTPEFRQIAGLSTLPEKNSESCKNLYKFLAE